MQARTSNLISHIMPILRTTNLILKCVIYIKFQAIVIPLRRHLPVEADCPCPVNRCLQPGFLVVCDTPTLCSITIVVVCCTLAEPVLITACGKTQSSVQCLDQWVCGRSRRRWRDSPPEFMGSHVNGAVCNARIAVQIGGNVGTHCVIVTNIDAGRAGRQPSFVIRKLRIAIHVTYARPASLNIAVSYSSGSGKRYFIRCITPENAISHCWIRSRIVLHPSSPSAPLVITECAVNEGRIRSSIVHAAAERCSVVGKETISYSRIIASAVHTTAA